MKTTQIENSPTRPVAQRNGSGDTAEVIFPALDAPKDTTHAVASKSPARWWLAIVITLVITSIIAIYFYQQRQPIIDHTGHTSTAPASSAPAPPQTAVRISPEKQQLIGVQYGTVENQSLSKSLRAVGRAAFDETKMVRINPKIEGWIEDVYVNFTGKLVNKGQPLLSIYSPDLVQTQEEYLLALKNRKQLGESPFGEAVNFSESLVQSAKRRLQLWDVTDAQIKELEARGTPSRTMTLYAPASGFVMTRNAYPKQRILPDTELYQLVDLSNIWIVADIYEFEAADVKVGQAATVTLSSFPGRTFSGKITYIYPQVDNTTRTLKVRIELSNKGFLLKPDMYADVTLNINYGNRLVVPQEAVLDSGSEQLVYVALADGYFEPRKIRIGPKVDDKYVVLNGLQAGERIVTSGNFLIDSESKLKSATSGMGMPGMDHSGHN